MPDFWLSSGYRLLERGSDGNLHVTDDFLRSFLARPELAPVPESCANELALHDRLMAEPRRAIDADAIAAIADADARDNYAIWMRFRDRLTSAPGDSLCTGNTAVATVRTAWDQSSGKTLWS